MCKEKNQVGKVAFGFWKCTEKGSKKPITDRSPQRTVSKASKCFKTTGLFIGDLLQRKNSSFIPLSVKKVPTLGGATQAWDLQVVRLYRELVVVSNFLADMDVPFGVNNDLLLIVDGDHPGVAVWLWE